jgi:hypothetical protein
VFAGKVNVHWALAAVTEARRAKTAKPFKKSDFKPIEKLFDLLLKSDADISDLLSKTSELPFDFFISKTRRFDVIFCKNVALTGL